MTYQNDGNIYDAGGHKIGEIRPRGELGFQGCLGIFFIITIIVFACGTLVVDSVNRAKYNGADSPQSATATSLTKFCAQLTDNTAVQIAKPAYNSAFAGYYVMLKVTNISIDTSSASIIDNFGAGCEIHACITYDFAASNRPHDKLGSDMKQFNFTYTTNTGKWTTFIEDSC